MRHYAVIGCPVAHSRSPEIYRRLFAEGGFEADFNTMLVVPGELKRIRALTAHLSGFAVTMPHKRGIMSYLDSIAPEALRCGSVNIVGREGDDLVGYNTDGQGLVSALDKLGLEPCGKRIAIYGRGGAALAAAHALADRGAEVILLVRSTEKRTDDPSARFDSFLFDSFDAPCDAFINATPLGMRGMPAFGSFDFLQRLRPQLVFDMVYLPQGETALVRHAQSLGLTASSGYAMLCEQALLAFDIWRGNAAR